MRKKQLWTMGAALATALLLSGCGEKEQKAENKETQKEVQEEQQTEEKSGEEPTTILMAAAASMEYSMKNQLIPMFEEKYPHITVEGTYDSSGKLQAQIEEGLDADLFLSAATKQMDALEEQGLVKENSVTELLENKIVLIAPKGQEEGYSSFEDLLNADTVALGDPASVPAGQYAQEALESLGIWDKVSKKASFGTNVTEVLSWVSEGSAEAGIVYATDAAAQKEKVSVVAEAPEGSLKEEVLYPMGMVSSSEKQEAAGLFMDFLESEEAAQVFEDYGFTVKQK